MKKGKGSREGSEGVMPGAEGTGVLRRSKRPLTAAVLAFVLAIAFFLPMSSGVASAAVTGSETDIVWADNLGGNGYDYFNGIAAAPDGGFVAVGQMSSSTLTNSSGTLTLTKMGTGNNTLIVKYDADGNIEWADNLGGDNSDYFRGVAAAPDGGFVAVGFMQSSTLTNNSGSFNLTKVGTGYSTLIVKYDADGNIVWADNLGGDNSDYFYGVTTAQDGGFAAVGAMTSSILENSDGSFSLTRVGTGQDTLIVKYDADGNIVWADNLGGDNSDYFYGVTTAQDGGFAAVGAMTSSILENSDGSFNLTKISAGTLYDTLIVKYDQNGNIEWADNLGRDGYDYFYGVTTAQDGGFAAVGCLSSSALENSDGSFSLARVGTGQDTLIVKYDADGNIVWADNLGGDGWDYFYGAATAPDGGFVAAGYMESSTLENSDGSFSLARVGIGQDTLIVKYDANGSIEWADNLGGDGYDDFRGVAAAPDGGFAAAGTMNSSALENSDGIFSLGMIDSGYDTLIVKYTGAPPEFTVTVTGDNVVSWSPATVTYGDVNIEITFVTESGYRVDSIVSVFMGTLELTEGTDYVFENGILKILRAVTGDTSIEVKTSFGGGGDGEIFGIDLWWVLIAALSMLSLLLLLGFLIGRRVKITGTITVNGKAADGAKVEYTERTEDGEKHRSVLSDKDGKYTIHTKIDSTVTITSVSKDGVPLAVKPPSPILVEEAFTEAHIE